MCSNSSNCYASHSVKKYKVIFFQVVDNNKLENGDKLGKIPPIYKELSENLQQFGICHEKLSIDESVILYYGCYIFRI